MNSPGIPWRRPSRRWGRPWTLLALFAGCSAGPGCDLPGRPKAGDRYVAPQEERSFNVLFQRNCVGCHGADGKLGPAPPLNDKLFLALIPDTELLRVISEGRPGTLMPAFVIAKGGQLTSEQVDILAGGIKRRWGSVEPPPTGTPSYVLANSQPDGAGAGNEEQGLTAFARACACCHGDHGQGDESAGAINDPDFLALVSDQALRRCVITGRADLGMPDYADPTSRPEGFQPLASHEVSSVVALLAGWRAGRPIQRKGD